MYAEVELSNDILEFIEYEKNHNESFEEMRNIVFTKEKLNQHYSMADMLNFNFMYQRIKASALDKVLRKEKLNFPEGFVFERLLTIYESKALLTVEEHFNQIQNECSSH